jgi:nonsense-mediated mRNA decay protein 3
LLLALAVSAATASAHLFQEDNRKQSQAIASNSSFASHRTASHRTASHRILVAPHPPTLRSTDSTVNIIMQATQPTSTPVQIPCCLCGTLIAPNPANQCSVCLAQQVSLQADLQRGPGGAPHNTLYQCRECRRYKLNDKHYMSCEPESPQLLALCLQQVNGLKSGKLHLVDSQWVWTEPHSMRFKLRLTVRAVVESTTIEQRCLVELHCKFTPCPDCEKQYKNRTWGALVQIRQRRPDGSGKSGLAVLEMALAKNANVRKHVLRMDTKQDGFDFYLLGLSQAQALAQYLQRILPIKISTSPKMVSEDKTNNVANMKYSVVCNVVPICKHDLIVIDKAIAKGVKFTGRLALVTSVKKSIHFIDASMSATGSLAQYEMDMGPDNYYKYEKNILVYQSSNRLLPFVVLDVEMIEKGNNEAADAVGGDTASVNTAYSKHTLAQVQVVRQSDLGVESDPAVFDCVTHIGHLLNAGDVVYGYDVARSMLSTNIDWQAGLQAHYNIPDVVLVYKSNARGDVDNVDGGDKAQDTDTTERVSKKKERRIRKKQGKKNKELVETATRMGFIQADDEEDGGYAHEHDDEMDPEMQAELAQIEAELDKMDLPGDDEVDVDVENVDVGDEPLESTDKE